MCFLKKTEYKLKKEKDRCKDCAEYGSEFCNDCLKEQTDTKQTETDESHLSNNISLNCE
jgi:hypothetical protein